MLEKENAAIRKEIALLRENRELQKQMSALKPANGPVQRTATISAAGAAKSDPFAAYAADLPMAYKAAPVMAQPRQFRIWGEGGAVWSGGDPLLLPYALGGGIGLAGFGGAGVLDLSPKLGWEGAGGFDYRFANSTWHVSGQFRYSESGKGSGAAAGNGAIDPALFGGGGDVSSVTFGDALTQSYQEKRWLADLAIGKDIAGDGPDALQIKGGLRVSESVGTTTTARNQSFVFTFDPPLNVGGFPPFSTVSATSTGATVDRRSFLGAGPLIGLEGSVPLTGGWTFDYLGNAAILFGTQKVVSNNVISGTIDPPFLAVIGGFGGLSSSSVSTTERFATMFSADLQVGVSYWLTQNLKLGVSYRMDALINVQNQDSAAVTTFLADRYTHGPRVRLTGQF